MTLNTIELTELERAAWCANDTKTLHAIEVAEQAAAEATGDVATDDYDRGYEDGREAGYEDGYEDGREAGREPGYAEGRRDGSGLARGDAERLAWRHMSALIEAEGALSRANKRLTELVRAINDRQPAAHIQSETEAVRKNINSAQVRIGAVLGEMDDFDKSLQAAVAARWDSESWVEAGAQLGSNE